jgi:MarR family 2-MHQ and catechol resistance regulon transcriptional repressor
MSNNKEKELSWKVWKELANTFELIEKSHSKRMSRYNLTNPQFHVLVTLQNEGAMPLKSIGKKLNVTGANITCVMDNLQKRKFAERVPSKSDRRIINAKLTKEGEKILREITPLYLDSITEETKNLTLEEKATLVKLLLKLRN